MHYYEVKTFAPSVFAEEETDISNDFIEIQELITPAQFKINDNWEVFASSQFAAYVTAKYTQENANSLTRSDALLMENQKKTGISLL